jgi:hypothetical protein
MKNLEQALRDSDEGILRPGDPIDVGLGVMVMVMPAALAFQIASELKHKLLDQYELVPGVPTPDRPEPEPYFKRKQEEKVEEE